MPSSLPLPLLWVICLRISRDSLFYSASTTLHQHLAHTVRTSPLSFTSEFQVAWDYFTPGNLQHCHSIETSPFSNCPPTWVVQETIFGLLSSAFFPEYNSGISVFPPPPQTSPPLISFRRFWQGFHFWLWGSALCGTGLLPGTSHTWLTDYLPRVAWGYVVQNFLLTSLHPLWKFFLLCWG